MNNNFNNFGNEFSSMNDLFNQLMGNMGGYSTERRSYKINGREVTPEEFAFYRQTGRLPSNEEMQAAQAAQQGKIKQDGILARLGTNLTQQARDGKLDPVIGRNKEIQEFLLQKKDLSIGSYSLKLASSQPLDTVYFLSLLDTVYFFHCNSSEPFP